jgi:hypothetical protein
MGKSLITDMATEITHLGIKYMVIVVQEYQGVKHWKANC